MTREQALNYLRSSGFSEEQIQTVVEALTDKDAVSREAVDELSKGLVHITRDKADFLCKFWEGLQKLPPVTPAMPTCENAVSRSAVLAIVKSPRNQRQKENMIEGLPSVQPERAKGEWIVHKHDLIEYLECDKCHTFFLHEHLVRNSFCPNCGRNMGGGE